MQHFLKPHFLRNIFRIPAYRFSKLACGGGNDYQGKITVHTNSTMFANEAKKQSAIAMQFMHEIQYTDTVSSLRTQK